MLELKIIAIICLVWSSMLTSFACTTRWLSQKSPYMSILGKRWAKVKKANERKKNVNLFVAVGEWSSCIKVFLISFFWWRGRGNLPKWKGERVSEKNCVSSKYIMFLVGHWRRTLNYKVTVVCPWTQNKRKEAFLAYF